MAECLPASAGKFIRCPQTHQSTLIAQLSQEVRNDLQVPKEMRTSLPKLVTLFSISFQFRHPQTPRYSAAALHSCDSQKKPPTQSGLCQLTNQLLIQVPVPPANAVHQLVRHIPFLTGSPTCLQASPTCFLEPASRPHPSAHWHHLLAQRPHPLICRHYHLIGDVTSFLPTSPPYLLANKNHQLTNFAHCLLILNISMCCPM